MPAAQAMPPTVAAPVVMLAPARYVLIEVASLVTGLSKKAIERKIERDVWIEGKQFRRKDGRIYIDMKAYERWVES